MSAVRQLDGPEDQLYRAGWTTADRRLPWGVVRGWKDPASGRVVARDTALRMVRKDQDQADRAWAEHVATHVPPNTIELHARALALGWSPGALASVWPHKAGLLAITVEADVIEFVHRDPDAPWLPGAREVYRREEIEAEFQEPKPEGTVQGPTWCACCAYAQSCDACSAARRAAGRGVVTLCLCAGRGPGLDEDGHAPGCPDSDQPWGPPYLYPVYQTEERWRRVDDPNHWRGFRWEKDLYTRRTAWRRVEEDDSGHTEETEHTREIERGPVSEEMQSQEQSQETAQETAQEHAQERSQGQPEETVIAVLDTETTGLFDRPRGFVPRIVEIAVSIVSVPSGRVIAFRSTRVNPEAPIPFGASNVHKIFDRDVRHERTWAEVYPRVAAFVEEHKVACVVAHNAAYDRDMVAVDCARIGVDAPRWAWLDSMKLARKHLPGRHSYALQKLREGLNLPAPQHGEAHSAAADVGTVGQLVVRCLRGRSWEEATEGLIDRPTPPTVRPPGTRRGAQVSLEASLGAGLGVDQVGGTGQAGGTR